MSTIRFAIAFLAGAIMVGGTPLMAKEVANTKTPEQMKAGCDAGGGINLPLNESGTYGCVNTGGTIILCGGQTEQQKKTCTIARMASKDGPAIDRRMAIAKKR